MNPPKSSKAVAETRRALIHAARDVFAENGFEGARVDRIADQAGVNKALINYHFGGKAELFAAIMEDFAEKVAKNLRDFINPEAPADSQLRCFVRHMGQAVAEHPEFPRLIIFMALRAKTLPPKPPPPILLVLKTLRMILEKGRREGSFKTINPIFAHMHIMSSLAMYHITRPVREKFPELTAIPGEDYSVTAFYEFVEDQILSGFALPPDQDQHPNRN